MWKSLGVSKTGVYKGELFRPQNLSEIYLINTIVSELLAQGGGYSHMGYIGMCHRIELSF